MDGNCNLENVVYQAKFFPKENNLDEKVYIGKCSLKWKFKYYNHKQSFRNPLHLVRFLELVLFIYIYI